MEYTMSAPPPRVMLERLRYAGFWQRVAAALIDALILALVFIPINALLGIQGFRLSFSPGLGESTDVAPLAHAAFLPIFFAELIVSCMYVAFMESSKWQGTVGRMAAGLRVTDLDGNPISLERAIGRYFAKCLSAICMMMGFVVVAFSAKKQGMHDHIAQTFVIQKPH